MPDRFFLPAPWGETPELPESEAHHFARVLRGNAGTVLEVFDGEGTWGTARVEAVSKRSVSLRLLDQIRTVIPTPRIVIASAAPKGDRLTGMIEKLTELGVDEWVPLLTQRTVVDPGVQKLAKLEQTVLAACKQSRRSRRLRISPPVPLAGLPEIWRDSSVDLWVGEAGAEHAAGLLAGTAAPARVVVVGPEGGLTPEELSLVHSWGGRSTAIGPHILRIETAAVAFASLLTTSRGAGLSST